MITLNRKTVKTLLWLGLMSMPLGAYAWYEIGYNIIGPLVVTL